jgi:outer membrane protein OmpA-like peptidoglycan-associated protein
MAVFTPGISPYSYADDDPINKIDYYGLGEREREERRREREQHRRERQQNRENRRRERERNRNAYQYDKGNNYNPNFTTYGPHDPTGPVIIGKVPSGNPPMLSDDISFSDPVTAEKIQLPIPNASFPIPDAGEKASFSKDILFISSSDRLYGIPANDQVLSELVKTLQDFSQVTLFIYGNVQIDGGTAGNSQAALTQEVRYNGQWRTANDLMVGRARAVYNYLIRKGIDPKRLNFGAGNVYNNTTRDMKKTSFEVRNP